jgi:hypothetical protein
MANEFNHIHHVLPAEKFADIKNRILSIGNDLSFMKDLKDEETVSFNKLSAGDKIFIDDCLNEAVQADGMLPAYTSVQEIRNSDLSHDQLWVLEDMLTELTNNVRRNRMLAADDAYSGVASIYNLIREAAKKRVKGAVAMFERLQSYHMKRVDAAKAAKAAKKKADEAQAQAIVEAVAEAQTKAAAEKGK